VKSKVYVNGEYVLENKAVISVFDRGFLFSDSIYEVTAVFNGLLVDWKRHFNRLERSLRKVNISNTFSESLLLSIQKELIKTNGVQEGMVYIQISRGSGDRDFNFAEKNFQPTLVIFTQKKKILETLAARNGIRVITIDDNRWKRRDIKTTQLLASSMSKTEAVKQGKDDCWLVEDGFITEGSSSNAFIINNDNELISRHLSNELLGGITRLSVIDFCKKNRVKIIERKFTLAEALNAKEAFITSATNFVIPVVEIDGKKIGDGNVGSQVRKVQQIYLYEIKKKLF
jgi:D-alanine transaminase